MAKINPVNSVESKGELFALEVAQTFVDGDEKGASAMFKKYADDNKLVMWEVSAINNIAASMIRGKAWKKD